MYNVKFTTDLSIFVQIVTGLVSMQGIFLKLPDRHQILTDVLRLETIVQFVELFFYLYFLKSMAITALPQMATMRYFDWFITTPTMLLTTIMYFKYEEHIEKNKPGILHFNDFLKQHKQDIITIFVCNFLMLLFGYLGEINVIDMTSSLTFGFVFFAMTFYIIYKNYAINSQRSLKLFYFILFIWGLYGIAALFTPYHKNNMFNMLDIFAKNFFGLYLYYKAKTLAVV
jgi:bacteriorhodopsin